MSIGGQANRNQACMATSFSFTYIYTKALVFSLSFTHCFTASPSSLCLPRPSSQDCFIQPIIGLPYTCLPHAFAINNLITYSCYINFLHSHNSCHSGVRVQHSQADFPAHRLPTGNDLWLTIDDIPRTGAVSACNIILALARADKK